MADTIDNPTPDNQRDLLFGQWTRHYKGLGLSGVIAIPNTTDADWLVYFEQWLKQMGLNFDNLNSDFDALVAEFNKLSASIPVTISEGITTKLGEERPGMVEEVYGGIEDKVKTNITNPIQEQVDAITSQNDGIGKLQQILYEKGSFNRNSAATAEFLIAPKLTRNAVMQAIHYDASLGQWFITQQDNLNPEGFVVSRVDAGGNLLSNMWFKGLGHGSATFIRSRPDNTPLIFFQNGSEYRKVPYADNTSVTVDNTLFAYKPPYDGNGMSSYIDGVMAHINNQTSEHLLSVYEANYNQDNNEFTFPENGKHVSLDITKIISDDVNTLQGIVILRKKDISGSQNDDGKYIIFVGGGTSSIQITMQPFEYNLKDSTLKTLDMISGLKDVIKPVLNENFEEWEGDSFEMEGLSRVSIDGSPRGDGYVSTVAYGISGGIIGKRRQFVFGFQNTLMSNFISSARSSFYDNAQTNFIHPNITELWRINKPGEYNLIAEDANKLIDFPNNWVGNVGAVEWNLFVGKPNQNGDFIQILYRRFYNSANEIYTRSINYTAGSYGENYLPSIIGTWSMIKEDSQYSQLLTAANGSKFERISSFSIPGSKYYVSASTNEAYIKDLEGLEKEISGRGFSIEVSSAGGNSDLLMQTLTYVKNGLTVTAKRTIAASFSQYGPAMDTQPAPGGWTIFTGGPLNADTWTMFNGSGAAKLSYKIKNGLVEIKAYNINTGNTGSGSTTGAIATLPDEIVPDADVWGIIANMDSKPVSLTISSGSKLLYISSLMGNTMTSTSVITLHVNYYV